MYYINDLIRKKDRGNIAALVFLSDGSMFVYHVMTKCFRVTALRHGLNLYVRCALHSVLCLPYSTVHYVQYFAE